MADDPLLISLRRKRTAYEGAGRDDLAKRVAKAIDAREKELASTDEVDEVDQYHVGGGWYEIGGEKVQGKDAARELLGG